MHEAVVTCVLHTQEDAVLMKCRVVIKKKEKKKKKRATSFSSGGKTESWVCFLDCEM